MDFSSHSFSIISFNAMGILNFDSWHGINISRHIKLRQAIIAEILALQNADIIALQEVHTYSFLKTLRGKLSDYPHVLYKRFLYGPRGSLVIFSKLPLENVQYVNFRDRGTIFNTTAVAKIRRSGMLIAKIKTKNIYIVNTHLTQNGDYNWSNQSKFYRFIKSQLNQVAQTVESIASSKSTVIAAGDFNTDKNSKLYTNFINNAKLLDLFKQFSYPTMHQEFLPAYKKAKRIDYIFLRSPASGPEIKNLKQLFTEKYILKNGDKRYLSDHIGLKVELIF